MNHLRRLLALSLAAGLALPVSAQAQEITVSAAASLQNALREIGAAYQAAHPGIKVNFNFAASGPLLAQIAQGAPVDVFASADAETMDKAEAQHLIKPETRVVFATNELVLVSPASLPASIKSPADLKMPGVAHIAIGAPATVPAGRYARSVLEAQGLWTELSPKFVFAENVRQALNYVSRAEAEAGFVYRTDALIDKDKVRIDVVVPTARPVVYPVALVAATRNAGAATSFLKFLTGPQGQAVLGKFGFTPAR
jgi:molybdate transport system substrate-binding protein